MSTAELIADEVDQAVEGDGLPELGTRAPGDFPDEKFVNIKNVPIFSEHSTKAPSGRSLTFTRVELDAICRRCNQRITETGDYAIVTVGHTVEPKDKAVGVDNTPEVVGFAGPFRLGMIGPPDALRWAILADLHVYQEDADCIRKYPRRSPELWVEESYDQMFLDPIALLGAEPPRLDMGLLYSASRQGKVIHKYTAVAPAAANVFVPEHESSRRRYESETANSRSNNMPLGQDEIRQIVDAMSELDWVKWVKDQMQKASNGNPNAGGEVPPADAGEESAPVVSPGADSTGDADKKRFSAGGDDKGRMGEGDMGGEDLPMKYSKLEHEFQHIKRQLEVETMSRVNHARLSRLTQLAEVKSFDVDEEFEVCRYGKMNDKDFERHAGVIEKNYRDIPVDIMATVPESREFVPATREGSQAKYSKALSDQAMKICEQRACRGELVSYEEVLDKLHRGEKA